MPRRSRPRSDRRGRRREQRRGALDPRRVGAGDHPGRRAPSPWRTAGDEPGAARRASRAGSRALGRARPARQPPPAGVEAREHAAGRRAVVELAPRPGRRARAPRARPAAAATGRPRRRRGSTSTPARRRAARRPRRRAPASPRHSTATASRSASGVEAWANGSGQEPTTAGVAHRVGPVAVVPPDPVAAADRDLGAPPIGDSIPLTKKNQSLRAAAGDLAGDAVDRLHEAAAVAGRDLGLAVEEADHGLGLRRVGLGRLEHRLGAVVAGHRQRRLALGSTRPARGRSRRPRRRAPPRPPRCGDGSSLLLDPLAAALDRRCCVGVALRLILHLVARPCRS